MSSIVSRFADRAVVFEKFAERHAFRLEVRKISAIQILVQETKWSQYGFQVARLNLPQPRHDFLVIMAGLNLGTRPAPNIVIAAQPIFSDGHEPVRPQPDVSVFIYRVLDSGCQTFLVRGVGIIDRAND